MSDSIIKMIEIDGEYCSMECPFVSFSDKDQCWGCQLGCFLVIHDNIPMRHPRCLKAVPPKVLNITGEKKNG